MNLIKHSTNDIKEPYKSARNCSLNQIECRFSQCNRNGMVLMMWIINARFLFISHKIFICRLSFFSTLNECVCVCVHIHRAYLPNPTFLISLQLNEHFNNNVVVFQHMLFLSMYIHFFLLFLFTTMIFRLLFCRFPYIDTGVE